MFYDRFIQLCEQKGVKPTRAAIENGIARSAVSNWKSNWAQGIESLPSTANANALADYFDVSVDYLLGNVSEPYFHLDNQRIADEINSLDGYKKPAAPQGNELSGVYLSFAKTAQDEGLDPADIEYALNLVRRIREQEKKRNRGE